MSRISTHVLDTAIGCPARGLRVTLSVQGEQVGTAEAQSWTPLGECLTDVDGRVNDLLGSHALEAGSYRLTFDTETYLAASQRSVFYPRVEVVFRVDPTAVHQHHHIPLLLSPFGYSTYRGS